MLAYTLTGGHRMKRGIPLLILATLFWSGNYIAGRVLAHSMPPLILNGVRWVISAALLWLILKARGRRLPLRKFWREFLIMGFTGMFVFSGLTYEGLRYVPAAQAGMISAAIPVAILVLGVFVIRDHPSWIGWTGALLSFVGVVILIGSGKTTAHSFALGGDSAIVAAAVSWGLYTVLGKKYSRYIDPLTLTAGAAVYGAIPSVGAALWTLPNLTIHMNAVAWLSLLYVSTGASVVAYMVWTTGVHWTGPSRSAPYMNLLPIWTVVLGVLVLHEKVGVNDWLGGAITVLGAVLASFPSGGPKSMNRKAHGDVTG